MNTIENKFRYTKTNCCCCSKLIDIYLIYDHTNLTIYTDQNRSKILVQIPKDDIVCINKRQIDKNDVYKFSIHYYGANRKLKEIKLKANSRSEMNNWIKRLREVIKPTPYDVKPENGYQTGTLNFNIKDSKKFYITLCHLEYILCRPQFKSFFDYYRKKKNPNYGINYEMESQNEETNNLKTQYYSNEYKGIDTNENQE